MMEVCKPALRCGGGSSSESSAFCARCVLPHLVSALVFTFLSFGAGLGPAFGDFFLARGLILCDFSFFLLGFLGFDFFVVFDFDFSFRFIVVAVVVPVILPVILFVVPVATTCVGLLR